MKVITNGRTDTDDYFRLSGIREHKKLSHAPFLVFVVVDNTVEIQIVDSASKLLKFPMKHKSWLNGAVTGKATFSNSQLVTCGGTSLRLRRKVIRLFS